MMNWNRLPNNLPNKDEDETEDNHAWDRLSKWQTYVDEKIREWLGDGDMSWHPGAGLPLDLPLDDDTPEELRLAYKIMEDNDAVPPWMSLGFVLRDRHEKILRKLQQYARDYLRRKQEALRVGSFLRDRHAEDRWNEALRHLREDVARYNRELLDYNLQVPDAVGQMVPLNLDEAVQDALQAAQNDDQS